MDGHGSGSSLPLPILLLAALSSAFAVAVSAFSILQHVKNYRKPLLQRMVVRIMLMVPIYAVSSLISLFSLEAAFVIDVIRDIYEAFVIYCFFVLLLTYIGGERSLLIRLQGRPPKPAVFPLTLFKSEIDPSDPYTFLWLKRGILQYVTVKPILALASLILKALGIYNEGDFRARSGYLYVSIVYNLSVCTSLYCLAVFWMCVSQDLKPYRPVPKFLCVKGILFFSFWQSILVAFLVAIGVITRLGPYRDNEHISLGLTDTLICLEMPFFAIAHMYAFSHRDYTEALPRYVYVARMRVYYALRDACGLVDVFSDSRATLHGAGITYRAFEPNEGAMHVGAGRAKRIRAGLRYTAGGKRKYWLPQVQGDDDQDIREAANSSAGKSWMGRLGRVVHGRSGMEEVGGEAVAPLLADEAADVVHDAPDMQPARGFPDVTVSDLPEDDADDDDGVLSFADTDSSESAADEALYVHARAYVFGDYNYPVVDVSSEEARAATWAAEECVLRDERSAYKRQELVDADESHPKAKERTNGAAVNGGSRKGAMYGAVDTREVRRSGSSPSVPRADERIIDFEVDIRDVQNGDGEGDIRLGWTRADKGKSSPQRQQKQQKRERTVSPPDGVLGASASSAHVAKSNPPPPFRAHVPHSSALQSSSPSSQPSPHQVTPLPRSHSHSHSRTPLRTADAVDLIIEDDDARGIGHPGLRRVWHGSESRVNHQDQNAVIKERVDPGELDIEIEHSEEEDSVWQRRDHVNGAPENSGPTFSETAPVVRTQTPPGFAQIPAAHVQGYTSPSPPTNAEENPWA